MDSFIDFALAGSLFYNFFKVLMILAGHVGYELLPQGILVLCASLTA